MSMLIPFWAWILLGIIIGWKARGFFVKKLSFVDKVRKPFRPRKKAPAKKLDEPEEEQTIVGKAKSTASKVTGFLAKPWERLLGDLKDKEDDDE